MKANIILFEARCKNLMFFTIIKICFAIALLREALGATKIIGGRRARPGEVPFMVAIIKAYLSYSDVPQHCGGSLISSRYVLTACHCLFSVRMQQYYSYDYLKFVAGETDISNTNSSYMQTRYGKRFSMHSKCTFSDIVEFDLALAELKEPFKLNERVRPVPFYSNKKNELRKHVDKLIIDAAVVLVAGWGVVHRNVRRRVVGPHLKLVEMRMISNNQCRALYCQYFISYCDYPFEERGQFCALGVKGNETDCNADSGGPVYQLSSGLVGLVSYGMECANPIVPSVFARVDDIVEQLSSHRIEEPEENPVLVTTTVGCTTTNKLFSTTFRAVPEKVNSSEDHYDPSLNKGILSTSLRSRLLFHSLLYLLFSCYST